MHFRSCLPTSRLVVFAALAALASGPARAGDNSVGVLFLHAHPEVTPSAAPCLGLTLGDCKNAALTHVGAEPVVLGVYAAFVGEPNLGGVAFGIEYDSSISISAYGSCADHEVTEGAWPASGEGTVVLWDSGSTEVLQPVYWFAAYDYYQVGGVLSISKHPRLDYTFVDGSNPSDTHLAANFGTFGFNGPEVESPCPESATGACCTDQDLCSIRTKFECRDLGRTYLGHGTTCQAPTCESTTHVSDENADEKQVFAQTFRVHDSPSDGGQLHFSWDVPCSVDSIAEVVDAAGRRVLQLPVGAGATSAQWSASRSERLASGSYWVRWVGSRSGASRFVVLR